MSRELGLDRSTCQRLTAAMAHREVGVEFLVRLPGTRGLQLFVDAVAARGLPPGEREAAMTAIDLADRAVREIAGSQSALSRRLSAAQGSGAARAMSAAATDATVMELLAGVGEHLTGRWSETLLLTQFYRPVGGDDRRVEKATINGYIRHRTRPGAMPLIVTHRAQSFTDPGGRAEFSDLGGSVRGLLGNAVMAEYSTQPLPIVTARGPRGGMVHTIDPIASGHDDPIDLVIARRTPEPTLHPAHDTPPIEEVWYSIRFPARRMVFDVFLHRSMARQCIASLDLHATPPDVAGRQAERWLTRLPRPPRLTMLGDDVSSAGTSAYPRYVELLDTMLGRLRWPAEEFVGFRCEVDFPMWNGVYIMSFDFGRHDAPRDPSEFAPGDSSDSAA